VPSPSDSSLDILEARIGHAFRDRELLARAVTHPSYLQDRPDIAESNQRLEFLGDAVLQLILTESLFDLYPGEREGVLSKRRAALANGVFLAQLAREIGLEAALRLAASEESTGGRTRASALEDAFEALIGAVYLDSDLDKVRGVVLRLYGPLADRLAGVEDVENPKGRLQELVQPVHGNNALRYEVVRIEGEDHAREFEVEIRLKDRPLGTGRGTSKKAAEEAAARVALAAISKSSSA
jgi:ribonuclease III